MVVFSSKSESSVEGATDLVRCEDVRSCAIDYAIRRDRGRCKGKARNDSSKEYILII